MTSFVLRRLTLTVPVLLLFSVVVFMLIHLTPGDPVAMVFMGGGFADREKVQLIRHQLGLDLPLPQQYAIWLSKAIRGDLGRSIRTNQPVGEAMFERLPATLELSALALVFSMVLTVGVGLAAGLRPSSRSLNTSATAVVLAGVAIPPFTLGVLLILVFSQWLNWLPPLGYTPLFKNVVANLRYMILPTITLGLSLALVARMTQVSLIDAIRSDYVRTARAKGLPESLVVRRHALKNALIPIITVIGLESGTLLGGVVLTESIFVIPGLGRFVVENILSRDYPMVQGAVLVLALSRFALNLGADLLYALVDPRIRLA